MDHGDFKLWSSHLREKVLLSTEPSLWLPCEYILRVFKNIETLILLICMSVPEIKPYGKWIFCSRFRKTWILVPTLPQMASHLRSIILLSPVLSSLACEINRLNYILKVLFTNNIFFDSRKIVLICIWNLECLSRIIGLCLRHYFYISRTFLSLICGFPPCFLLIDYQLIEDMKGPLLLNNHRSKK